MEERSRVRPLTRTKPSKVLPLTPNFESCSTSVILEFLGNFNVYLETLRLLWYLWEGVYYICMYMCTQTFVKVRWTQLTWVGYSSLYSTGSSVWSISFGRILGGYRRQKVTSYKTRGAIHVTFCPESLIFEVLPFRISGWIVVSRVIYSLDKWMTTFSHCCCCCLLKV